MDGGRMKCEDLRDQLQKQRALEEQQLQVARGADTLAYFRAAIADGALLEEMLSNVSSMCMACGAPAPAAIAKRVTWPILARLACCFPRHRAKPSC